MKNKWLDEPTKEGFWWRKIWAGDEVSMTFVEIRENNPTFPKIVYFMNGRSEKLAVMNTGGTPYIQWQKVEEPND